MPAAVIFDLDGVLMDSEQLWNEAKETLVGEAGGRWREEAPAVMMGMSSPEWSAYLHDDLGVPMEFETINLDVVRRMKEAYRRELPLLPGADTAVRTLAAHWPLALASSSNREIIDLSLELAGFVEFFRVTVSSEEVERGKPAPTCTWRQHTRCVSTRRSAWRSRTRATACAPLPPRVLQFSQSPTCTIRPVAMRCRLRPRRWPRWTRSHPS